MRTLSRGAMLLLLILAGCTTPGAFQSAYASGYYAPQIIQCVPYARQVSGILLYGNADSWWQSAASRYKRGQQPQRGSVIVLKQTPRMHSGHVAVVTRLYSSREIDVTHSNWGNNRNDRRIIYESMRVQDLSGTNDWSRVRFWNPHLESWGLPYASYGFIYPQ